MLAGSFQTQECGHSTCMKTTGSQILIYCTKLSLPSSEMDGKIIYQQSEIEINLNSSREFINVLEKLFVIFRNKNNLWSKYPSEGR